MSDVVFWKAQYEKLVLHGDTLEWKVSLLKGCVAELREENEELRRELRIDVEVVKRLVAEVDELYRKLTDERTLGAAISRDCNNTALERNKLRGDNARLTAQLEELREENEELRAEVADMTGSKQDWVSRCFDDNGFHH